MRSSHVVVECHPVPISATLYIRNPVAILEVPAHCLANSALEGLGWRPAETFESGIRKTVRWYLENRDWVANVQSGTYRDWMTLNYDMRAAHMQPSVAGA